MIKINSLGTSIGKIVYNQGDEDILHLPVMQIAQIFNSSGVILFRGFGVTHELMKAFSEKFSSRSFQDYERPCVDADQFVHIVDEGTHSIELHCEHAYSPLRPDVLWFCCAVPAAQGGETTFCDGVQVWEELSEESKQLFVGKKIQYHNNVAADTWKKFMGSDILADLKQMLDGFESVNYIINEDQSLSMKYVCSAVVKTKCGNHYAFANSLLTWHIHNGGANFEDGLLIPDTIMEEIQEVTNKLTNNIQWQAGDLVMIDNLRFLHGRRAFNDSKRQIFSTLSDFNISSQFHKNKT